MTRAWSITQHVGLLGLEELREEWRALTDSMPNRRTLHLWDSQRAFAEHLSESPETALYVALRDDARTARAICPLDARVDRSLGFPLKAWGLPVAEQWPLADVIAPESDVRRELADRVVGLLRDSHSDRAALVAGPHDAASGMWRGLDPDRSAAYQQSTRNVIDCAGPYEKLASAYSKNHRHNLRKAHNKAAKAGGSEFVSVRASADLGAAFERFLEIEASGWKGEAGTALKFDAHSVAFYRDLLATLGDRDCCRIDELFVEGECISSALCFRAGRTLEMFKIAYREEFGRFKPGGLLVEQTLRDCCEDTSIDFVDLMSCAAWQEPWGVTPLPMNTAFVALNPLGSVAVPALRFRFGPARRVARRLRRART